MEGGFDFRKSESLNSLREQEFRLNAQIGELEEILASHARREERLHREKREIVLPPLDDMIGELEQIHAPHSWTEQRHHRQKRENILPAGKFEFRNSNFKISRRRRRPQKGLADSLYFFVLLLIAIALGFWLFYPGG